MKFRILVVGPTPPPYHGGSVMTANLLNSSLASQFELIHLDTADRRGITNIGFFDWHNVWLAILHGARFMLLLMRMRPHIVYIPISQGLWGYLRDLLFFVPARLMRKKIVIHLHGSYFRKFYESMPHILQTLTCWILSGTARVIVLGECLRPLFYGLIASERICVVPNGIEDLLPPDSDTDDDPFPLVLYLSNLKKAKGFLDVLNTVPLVAQHWPKVKFVLAGGLPCQKEAEEAYKYIVDNNISSLVHMPGPVAGAKKTEMLLHADVFVFPPRAPEGQPLVILEAMAANLPIVTTDRGAIKETVLDGVNCFIVSAGDVTAIANRIIELLSNDSLRQVMGTESRHRFLQNYTRDRWAKRMIDVFEQVLSTNDSQERC